MADIKGKGNSSKRKMFGTYVDSQVVKKDGEILGFYADIQLDQSGISPEDAKAGKADARPHLVDVKEVKEKDGKEVTNYNHTHFYYKGQMEALLGNSTCVDKDGKHYFGFVGDVGYPNGKTDRLMVMCPKESDKEGAAEWNDKHSIEPNPDFTIESVEAHNANVKVAREVMKAEREAQAAVEMNVPQVENEAEAELS